MALISATFSSKHRRAKAFAIRHFPPLCRAADSSAALPPMSGSLTDDQNVAQIKLTNLPPEKASCSPGSDFLSHRGNIKRPTVFALRSFPKGCGPLATSVSKPTRSKEASTTVVRGITEKGNGSDKIMEDILVGRSLGEKDVLKPNVVEENGSRPEGSDSKNEVEQMEEKLNIVRTVTKEASDLGKTLENAVVGSSLGENDGDKPIRKSSNGLFKDDMGPESSDSNKKLNDTMKIIPKRSSLVKNVEIAVVGRSLGEKDGKSLGEKDGKKPNKKRPLEPDLVESGRRQSGQSVDLRRDRLVVQALMAAKRCPWMLGKNKISIGLQSRQKKPRAK